MGKCKVRPKKMIVFESNQSYIDEIEKLGIITVLVKNGMTMRVLIDGLVKYSKMMIPNRV